MEMDGEAEGDRDGAGGLAHGTGPAATKRPVTMAEFTAALKEAPPPLPPISQLKHVIVHSQPPHGAILKSAQPPSRQGRQARQGRPLPRGRM
jgi:hypothetical protein